MIEAFKLQISTKVNKKFQIIQIPTYDLESTKIPLNKKLETLLDQIPHSRGHGRQNPSLRFVMPNDSKNNVNQLKPFKTSNCINTSTFY